MSPRVYVDRCLGLFAVGVFVDCYAIGFAFNPIALAVVGVAAAAIVALALVDALARRARAR